MRTRLSLNSGFKTTDEECNQVLNVLIAYDTVAAGQRAMRLCSKLDRGPADETSFEPRPWRFDLLAAPDWREFATADALRADLLIVSATSQTELPPAVENWLTACFDRKQGTLTAVIALLGMDELEDADSPKLQFLRRAAKEAGLEFFAPVPRADRSLDWTTEKIHRRAETVTRTLEEILHPSVPSRHWGINE